MNKTKTNQNKTKQTKKKKSRTFVNQLVSSIVSPSPHFTGNWECNGLLSLKANGSRERSSPIYPPDAAPLVTHHHNISCFGFFVFKRNPKAPTRPIKAINATSRERNLTPFHPMDQSRNYPSGLFKLMIFLYSGRLKRKIEGGRRGTLNMPEGCT